MSLKIGIAGLPNAGKSTLFNALLKRQQAQTENRPFTTIEPNVGIVDVPDLRMPKIADIVKPEKIIPATIEFIDIAGLVKDAHLGEGLGNQFLALIREVDAIIILLRSFTDNIIIHTEGRVDPKNDLEIILTEFGLADAEHPDAPKLLEKPRLVVHNVDDNDLRSKNYDLKISAKIESELAELLPVDQKLILGELGVSHPPLNRVILKCFKLLNLHTFFTAGPNEVRAWIIKIGSTAPQAASIIHTDFQKGFIKAEIISFDDYVKFGGEHGAKTAGKLRIEGKDYIMRDGDIAHFRFNV